MTRELQAFSQYFTSHARSFASWNAAFETPMAAQERHREKKRARLSTCVDCAQEATWWAPLIFPQKRRRIPQG